MGFGGVTMTMIAGRAQLSKQIAVYHFKSTEEILLELVNLWGEIGRQVTVEHLASLFTADPTDKLVGMSDGMFIFLKRYPAFGKLTPVIFQAAQHFKAVAKIHDKTLHIGRERIRSFLKASSQYSKASEKELNGSVLGIHCLMYGAILYVIANNAWEETEQLRLATNSSIRSMVMGRDATKRIGHSSPTFVQVSK